ncbi:winged helix DNA-binding domain-containing protein [Streptomyces sp. NPDC004787]|uniref:winged helix DNA-binding domain-containing protein n=1 Tax=Streptomyces sp. NPDC004787 TaxID=3154291 RepID=UPI0033B21EBC
MGDSGTTAALRTIAPEERRARLAVRHRLAGAARATTAEEVADSLVALHATDPATVFLAAGARLAPGRDPVTEVERALYGEGPGHGKGPGHGEGPTPDERTTPDGRTGPDEGTTPGGSGGSRRAATALTRMHGMRHTVFVVPSRLAAVVHASTTDAASARERARLVKQLVAGSDYDADWLAETERQVLAELAARGEATGTELGAAVPRLRAQYVYGVGTNQEGPQSVGSRVLRVLGMEGRIVRGRPQGGWTSSRFRWAPAPPYAELAPDEAQAELVRHWLAAYGPATEADLKWWTGWKVTDVRRALAAVGAVRVALADGAGAEAGAGAEVTGYLLPDDLDPVPAPAEPWAALLPALDPTPMGWQSRDWYLDPAHRDALFDRSGNIGPTVWWNGRIVGGWAQRADGEVVWRALAELDGEAVRAVEAEAARLADWVGAVRVTPRFRTPLEKELTS